MSSPATTTITAESVLAGMVTARRAKDQAEVDLLVGAAAWADLHPGLDPDWVASFAPEPTAGELPLAAEGSPRVDVRCLAELGAALGRSTEAARLLVGDALDLRHRLPRLWQTVLELRVPVWQARDIAQWTHHLSRDCVDFVDRQLAIMPRIGSVRAWRLVEAAIARFDPETAELQRLRAAEHRRVDIDAGGRTDGLAQLSGVLDVADAVDLDAALNHRAAELLRLGVDHSLNVRRSIALGDLGRLHQDTLDLQPAPTQDIGTVEAAVVEGEPEKVPGRQVVLYLHLTERALTGRTEVAWLGSETTAAARLVDVPLLTGQVRDWCHRPDTTVVVKPVIDLHEVISVPGYQVPDRIHERLHLRDRHCIFPHCRRRRVDADHNIPWPHGQTSTENLHLLCRHHHRMKTFTRWRYRMLRPGLYLWTSPHGRRYLRDHHGSYHLE